MVQVKEARLLIDAGALRGCTAAPAPLAPDKWVLLLHCPDGRSDALERQRGGERVFSRLCSAADTVKSIGIRKLLVEF